jgi:hypothetical protein
MRAARGVAVGILAAAMSAGCSNDGGRPPASEQPRDDDITAVLDGLWSATGVDMEQVHIGDYAYEFAPDSTGCADLDVDDRWFGARSSSIPPGLLTQADVEASIASHLEGEGFEVDHYRGTHPADTTRGLDAVKDDVRVYGFLSEDGFADINVRAGPCAPTFGGAFDDDTFELDT